MKMQTTEFEKTLVYKGGRLSFLDQTLLPHREQRLNLTDYKKAIEAIKSLRIRGAPAIGIAGAFSVALAARNCLKKGVSSEVAAFKKAVSAVREARPTAINLAWAVDRQMALVAKLGLLQEKVIDRKALFAALEREAQAILDEDLEIGLKLADVGSTLIQDGDGVLTHCNAGGLATAGMGSALSVLWKAKADGRKFTVYVDETRPLLQGARLTAYELGRWGIPHILICDNMAAQCMKEGRITKVIIGADRIALNGDACNKIGSYGAAVQAHYHRLPFYVAAPYSTFDPKTDSGKDIPIEERAAIEVTAFRGTPAAPKGTRVYNPAFDVVPAALIRALVTEQGLIHSPDRGKVKAFLTQGQKVRAK